MSLDALLESVSQECQEPPDFEWTSEITETSRIENYHFASFHNFAAFPLANLGPTLSFEAELLSSDDSIVHRAQSIIQTIGNLAWDQISDMALLSWALHRHPDLLRHIPADSPIVTVVWCLAQCVHVDPDLVMAIWRERLFHPPPVAERIECQAVLLLLESCVRGFQPGDIPPFSSDEFETVFCLAYCSSRSLVPRLASWVLPQLIPLIVQSRAAHLVFRRILPYCVLQTKEGRRVATQVCEEIIGDHVRFPSCVSTWITMHPSNNLLVDLYQRGLLTSQMKPIIRQLINMNKRLLKGKIKLTEDVKKALPRCLWRVEFPPPRDEIVSCNATCGKILGSIESKRLILLTFVIIFVVMYLLYIYLE